MAPLNEFMEKWAKISLSMGWVEDWVPGAIFPREMAFFLARCEQLGVKCIVESGRQNGYSTKILGEYVQTQENRVRVCSIDYELDAGQARRCRERLAGYPIELLKGDSNILLGQVVRDQINGPVAILMDGPKDFWAMSLLFASAEWKPVSLLAMHNLEKGQVAREFYDGFADEPIFYEAFEDVKGEHWEQLRAVETKFCLGKAGERSPDSSSLGVMHVTEPVRPRIVAAFHPNFKLFQPLCVRWGWKLGLYRLTSRLFSLSFRLSSLF